jgi:hypothetical protein
VAVKPHQMRCCFPSVCSGSYAACGASRISASGVVRCNPVEIPCAPYRTPIQVTVLSLEAL